MAELASSCTRGALCSERLAPSCLTRLAKGNTLSSAGSHAGNQSMQRLASSWIIAVAVAVAAPAVAAERPGYRPPPAAMSRPRAGTPTRPAGIGCFEQCIGNSGSFAVWRHCDHVCSARKPFMQS